MSEAIASRGLLVDVENGKIAHVHSGCCSLQPAACSLQWACGSTGGFVAYISGLTNRQTALGVSHIPHPSTGLGFARY